MGAMAAPEPRPVPFRPPRRELGLTPDRLLRQVGYDRRRPPPAAVAAAAAWVVAGALARAAPRAGYLFAGSLQVGGDSVRLAGVEFRTGPIISAQLGEARSAAVFLATAGPGVESWASELLQAGDPLCGYLADACGSFLAEAAAEWLCGKVAAGCLEAGTHTGNRLSPGYCGWPVEDQERLFRMLPAGFCGVSLRPSSLMVPLKSVSGLIGIGPSGVRRPYPCATCTRPDCMRRGRG